MDKSSQHESAASEPGAGRRRQEAALGVLLLLSVSAILLFASFTFVQTHGLAAAPTATVLAVFSLIPAGWALWSLESRRRASSAQRLLARLASYFRVDATLVPLYPLAPVLAMAGWLVAGDKARVQFPVLTALLWVGAIGAVLAPAVLPMWKERNYGFPRNRRQLLLVAALAVGAFALRAYHLAQIPWLLTGDEGAAGLFSAEYARGVWNNPFTVGWFSFPSLYFILPGASIRLFGQTVTALRLTSALAGTLTVVALYGYGREAFGPRQGLIAAIFLAAFHFHIHFSRIGLNNIWDPLFFVLFSGTLWHAWTQYRPSLYALPGLAMGFSLYFYASSRAMPVMLLAWLVVAFLKNRQSVKRRLPGLLVLVIAFCAAGMPLILYFLRHPSEFSAPLTRVGYLGSWLSGLTEGTFGSVLSPFLQQLRASALAFTSIDLAQLYQPGRPMLFPLGATLFSFGIILLLTRIKDLRYLWLALWLGTGIVASTLSHGAPSSQRFIFVAPTVALLVSFPLNAAYEWLRDYWEIPKRQAASAIAVILLISVAQNLSFYFFDYSPGHSFGDPNTEAANLLAQYLEDWPDGTKVYFLASYMGFHSHKTVGYLVPHVAGTDIVDPVDSSTEFEVTGPTMFIATLDRAADLEVIRDAYPSGSSSSLRGDQGETLLYVYTLPSN